MGCPSFVIIGNNLKFSITCHDPDTGVLTDADATPTYLLYEDANETALAISGNVDTGTGAGNDEFDDANTTGYYAKLIACTIANGFEDGKTYSIYIEADVGGDIGGISFEFTAYTNLARAGANTWTYTLTDDVSGLPIAGASVWVTSDIAGANVIASGATDAAGQVIFYLDTAAAVYVWRSSAGYTFVNPDIEAIP